LHTVPPSGHVAGLASRLDREFGPTRTPANAGLDDVVDLATGLSASDETVLNAQAVNLIRCVHGRGLQVWGGRTLDRGAGRFIAHRRLVHRLVRAFRRVAFPLVFERNGVETQYALRRAIAAVLAQAFRSGALHGQTPNEAFEVRCDETTTTAAERAAGQVICHASFVPADPIERINVRLSLRREGQLAVVEP
jgi:uncharacterized protein